MRTYNNEDVPSRFEAVHSSEKEIETDVKYKSNSKQLLILKSLCDSAAKRILLLQYNIILEKLIFLSIMN